MHQINIMKNLFNIFCFALLATLVFVQCENKPERPDPVSNTSDNSTTIAPPPALNTNTPAASTAAAGGVQHYICPNNCEGSGGPAAGTCPTCGTAYTHNQAFHNQGQANAATTPAASQPINVNGATQIDPPATLPAANPSGVFHYICANGCAGGAAGAGNCSSCGGELTHNQAYHN